MYKARPSFFYLFLFCSSLVSAQLPVRLNPTPVSGEYSVIAFQVEFQDELVDGKDSDPFTEGTGRFVTTAPDTGFLDSYPRDKTYFSKHLEFLKSYWERVSGGKISLSQLHVASEILVLPGKMRTYSAYKQTAAEGYSRLVSDFLSVAAAKPELADEIRPFYSGEKKTHFILFHAGMGKDINWGSILGGDPTPADISSIYLSPSSAIPFSPAEIYPGITLSNLSILPETLSRVVESYGKKVLISFGINGIMTANFGNFLGLPDLYNTSTGASVTGRFGLMDGYGIFNFNGFFPSPPNAWEQYQLGWITPEVKDISALPELKTINPGQPFFIHLGDKKYFLLETLHRNPNPGENGTTISYFDRGEAKTLPVSKDIDGFYEYDQSLLKGIITDISNPWWVIPAGINEKEDTIRGGMLIWKINDGNLYSGMTPGEFSKLNSKEETRVLTLLEADGSQDIGQVYGSFTGGSGSEAGTIFDYWTDGNIAPLYKGEFSAESVPSSNWEKQAQTGIQVKGFIRAGKGIQISFNYSAPANPVLISRKLLSLPEKVTGKIRSFYHQDSIWTVAVHAEAVSLYQGSAAAGTWPISAKEWVSGFSNPASSGDTLFIAIPQFPAGIRVIQLLNGQISDALYTIPVLPGRNSDDWRLSGSLVFSSGSFYLPVQSKTDNNWFIARLKDGQLIPHSQLSDPAGFADRIFFQQNGQWFSILGNKLTLSLGSAEGVLPHSEPYRSVNASSEDNQVVIQTQNGQFKTFLVGYSAPGSLELVNEKTGSTNRNLILNGPEDRYQFFISSDSLSVSGYYGNLQLEGFPVEMSQKITGIQMLESAGNLVLVLKSGQTWYTTPVHGYPSKTPLSAGINPSGLVSANGRVVSAQLLADSLSVDLVLLNGFFQGTDQNPGEALRVAGKSSVSRKSWVSQTPENEETVYSWPNPSKDGLVHFRILVPFTGTGKITLLDLGGQKVTDLSVSVQKNTETEITWNSGSAQSGMYFASVDLSGEGKSLTKILKVVLIR